MVRQRVGLLEQGARHGAGDRLKRILAGAALALAAAAALLAAAARADSGHPAAPRARAAVLAAGEPARVIVKYRADSTLAKAAARTPGGPRHAGVLGPRLGLALADGRVLGPRTQSVHAAGIAPAALAKRLAALPEVEWAVVAERRTIHGIVPGDPYYGGGPDAYAAGQWFLRAPDSRIISATDAVGAWGVNKGSASTTVAVIDTGVRLDHPDLAGKLHPGYDFVSRTSISNDGDGRDDDASDPGDWSVASDSCGAVDSSWHGTQVAGLIGAATDNGLGVAGIGRDVMLLPVRVLGKCGGFDDDIIAGMRWAAGLSADPVANAHPARVINMSLGSTGACPSAYRDAIAELNTAGVAVVVAAGNGTGRATGTPANCPGAIAVAGLRHAGTKVGYSNIGPEVAIAAPAGNCILVTPGWPCLFPLVTTTNDGLREPAGSVYSSSAKPSLGTSFSAPLVAGVAALMLSQDPALTPAQLRTLMQSTARAFPTIGAADATVGVCAAPGNVDQLECYCTKSTCGAGMLDASAALAAVAGRTAAPAAVIVASDLHPGAGSTVTLDAGSSRGGGLGYQWSVTPATAAHLVGAANAAQATLRQDQAGVVTVALTVTDGNGARATTTKTLGVEGPAVSISSLATSVEAGRAISLAGIATATAGRTIAATRWEITAGSSLATIRSDPLVADATIDGVSPGSVTLQFSAADDAGDSATTTFALVVAPAVTPPPSSSGGGAIGLFGLAGLLAATVALRRRC